MSESQETTKKKIDVEICVTTDEFVEKQLKDLKDIVNRMSADKKTKLLGFAKYLDSQTVIQHDNANLLGILPYLLTLQNTKETQYGRSWCKHEDFSAFFNVERKWDRIYNIMGRVIEQGTQVLGDSNLTGTPTETFMDTIVDLGLYSLMWAGLIKETRPEQYEKFLVSNGLKQE